MLTRRETRGIPVARAGRSDAPLRPPPEVTLMPDQPRDDRRDHRRDDDREIDRLAHDGGKSAWQEASEPAAGDPVGEDERRGLNVLGQSDPRGNGAIAGAADPNDGDVPGDMPGGDTPGAAGGGA